MRMIRKVIWVVWVASILIVSLALCWLGASCFWMTSQMKGTFTSRAAPIQRTISAGPTARSGRVCVDIVCSETHRSPTVHWFAPPGWKIRVFCAPTPELPVGLDVKEALLLSRTARLGGFQWGEGLENSSPDIIGYRKTEQTYAVIAPGWFVLLVGTVPIVVAWRRVRRRQLRQQDGCCLVCGYDLRATPDRCPECGTAVSPGTSPNKDSPPKP